MAHKQIIPEDTVLVSVVSPTGLPVTPLCFVPIGRSLLKEIQEVLDAEDVDFEPLQVKLREISPLDVVQATDLESPEPEIEEVVEPEPEPITEVIVEAPKPVKVKKEKTNG
jgi:hypothetical protein